MAGLRDHAYVSENQLARLAGLLAEVLPTNAFQRARLGEPRFVAARTAEAFSQLPLSTKAELVADVAAHPPFGTNLTHPIARYVRYFQTSGTTGAPLPVLDTAESWAWWARCWAAVLGAGGVTAVDRVYFAFSFGPFVGFWGAHEGATSLGALCIPGGGATSLQRLRAILVTGATVVLCTPSYALHLAEVAAQDGQAAALQASAVRLVVVAGELGGSVPATRARIAEAFGAEVMDHAGASELGAWGIGCEGGLRVNEGEFIAEVIDPDTGAAIEPGAGRAGELVLTSLGRVAWPVIRHRTGDLVRPVRRDLPGAPGALICEGGVLGRIDDMITVRGVNVFPAAIEEVVRQVAGGAEFRVLASRRGALDELAIEAEADAAICGRIGDELRARIGIRVDVRAVARGALVPPEAVGGKTRRFLRLPGGL